MKIKGKSTDQQIVAPCSSFRDEAIRVSRSIHNEVNAPLYVGLSGGLSSEMVAESFRAARVPFRAAILRFKKDLNIHDIARAVIYCETRGVPYDFFEIDVANFFKKRFKEFCKIAPSDLSGSPATSELIRKISDIGGFAVLGGGLPSLSFAGSKRKWTESESSLALSKWSSKNRIDCECRFFGSDPDLVAAYVNDRTTVEISPTSIPADYPPARFVRDRIALEHFNLRARKSYHGYERYFDAAKLVHG